MPERGLATAIMPILPLMTAGGSTDVADISWNVPTALLGWPTSPLGIGKHNWSVTACGRLSIGLKEALAAARFLAASGFALMTDAALRAGFDQRRAGRTQASRLPLRPPCNAERAKQVGQSWPGSSAGCHYRMIKAR